jgi:hypothetical protein
MEQNSNDEIDLGLVYRKIGGLYKSLLIGFYKSIQFVSKNWLIFLSLIVAGAVLGYFEDKTGTQSKETTLIVQINFGGSNSVYDAIDQLNNKIKESNTSELATLGFVKEGNLLLRTVEIEPIVNLVEILKKMPNRGDNMDVLLETSQFEDDLLTSELFTSEYSSHKILLTTSSFADDTIISDLIKYLNSNEILNSIKRVTIENTKRKIEYNIQSIAYLDSIFKIYGSKVAVDRQKDQIYFNSFGVENGNIHLMFREKRSIQNETELLEIELLKYDNIVETINRPTLKTKSSVFSNKKLVYPVLLVFVFLMVSVVRRVYKKAKRLNAENQIS